MKNINFLFLMPLVALCLSSCGEKAHHETSEYKAGEIVMDETSTSFNILQLTDIHLSDKDNQEIQFKFLDLTISDAIKDGADLIVLTGDSLTLASKATAYRLFSFIDSYNVPWSITWGNHDEQCTFSISWLTSYLNNLKSNLLFKDIQGDDVFGDANYFIDVKQNNQLFEKVIIMDSNRYYFNDYFGYDYFKTDQIDWYERVIKTSPDVDSVMFFHIPLPEFEVAYNLYKEGSSEVTYYGGDNLEGVSAPKYNSGMFKKIIELGSTKGIFVGHDHENDSAIEYKGVLLSYGTNSSDRIYSNKDKIGGQLISIGLDHKITLTRYHHSYSEVE